MAQNRDRSRDVKEERIVIAALELFGKKGFEKTSVESITRKAKIAKGTFYNFFEKKEDVLLYFLDREYSKSEAEIARHLGAQHTFIDQVESSITAYIKNIFHKREFTKVLIKERIGKIGTGKNKNELHLMQALFHSIDNVALSRAGTFVTVEDAVGTQADVKASNGVVHVIDRVLIPPKR